VVGFTRLQPSSESTRNSEAALGVVEQVFAPAELLVVTRLGAHAVLEAHHLPLHALQLAHAAQRDQRPHRLVLRRAAARRRCLAQVDQAVAARQVMLLLRPA
jgi:hypothetical protein